MLQRHEELDGIRNTISGPIRLATIDRVIYELQRIARSCSSETSGLARIALRQLEGMAVPVLETIFGLGNVDAAIIATSLSEKDTFAVATVDRKLRGTLCKQGISTIYPRKGRGLAVTFGKISSAA